MSDAFDDAWDIAKYQGRRHEAERAIEQDPYAAVDTPLPVAGNKGSYSGLLRNIANRLKTKEVYDPYMGGGAVGFAVRPDTLYGGNDLNPFIPSFFRRMKEDPKSLAWNFDEEYGMKAGDVMRFKKPNPLDTREFSMKPITEELIDAWHEKTGGLNVDSDRMLNIPFKFRQHLNRLNELQTHPNIIDFNSKERKERDRLVGILRPQMIGGHFRLGEADIPGKHYINIASRGPPSKVINETEKKIGTKSKYFQDVWDEYNKKSKKAGDIGPIKSKHFFYPADNFQGMGRTKEQKTDREHNYSVYSKIMNDDNWQFVTGDGGEYMDKVSEIANPFSGLLTVDPPYIGDEVGEHRIKGKDWGQKGGFTDSVMRRIKPITDKGVPTIAFNSGDSGKSPSGRTKSDIMRDMYGLAGLKYLQLNDRNNKGTAQKGATKVGESIGTNIPWLDQKLLSELEEKFPVYPEGYRGSWSHNNFSTAPS